MRSRHAWLGSHTQSHALLAACVLQEAERAYLLHKLRVLRRLRPSSSTITTPPAAAGGGKAAPAEEEKGGSKQQSSSLLASVAERLRAEGGEELPLLEVGREGAASSTAISSVYIDLSIISRHLRTTMSIRQRQGV